MSRLEILVVDIGGGLAAYDSRAVLGVEDVSPAPGTPGGDEFVVRLGRLGSSREVRCRKVLGFYVLTPRDVRPLPAFLEGRIAGEVPWAVGIIDPGLCLLY